jgi:hypothetical protein
MEPAAWRDRYCRAGSLILIAIALFILIAETIGVLYEKNHSVPDSGDRHATATRRLHSSTAAGRLEVLRWQGHARSVPGQ